MAIIGEAFIAVRPDAKGFGPETEKGVLGSVSSIAKKAAAILGGALVVTKGFDFLKGSVAEAREANKVGAQTAAVIASTGSAAKVTAQQVSALATAISNKTGIDDEQIQSAANMLLTFKGLRNEVGKGNDIFNQATQIATDMGAAFHTDASASAIQLGKALNDPIAGITALTRVGVTFTQKQKDQIKTMVESGNVLGAQKIILAELTSEFGGSAAAQATAGEKLKVIYGNLREDLGNKLIPVIDRVAGVLATDLPRAVDFTFRAFDRLGSLITTHVVPAFRAIRDIFNGPDLAASFAVSMGRLVGVAEDAPSVDALATALHRVGDAIAPVTGAVGAVIDKLSGSVHKVLGDSTVDWQSLADHGIQHTADVINTTLDFFDRMEASLHRQQDILIPLAAGFAGFAGTLILVRQATAAISLASTIASTLGPALGTALGAGLAAIGGPITLIVAAVVALAAGLVVAYLKVKPFHDAVNKLAAILKDAVLWAFDRLVALLPTIGAAFEKVGSVVVGFALGLGRAATGAYQAVVTALTPLGRWLQDNVLNTLGAAVDFFSALGTAVINALRPVLDIIEAAFTDLMIVIRNAVAVIGAVLDPLTAVVGSVLGTIGTLLGDFARVALPVLTIAFQEMSLVVETVFGVIRAVIESVLGIIRGLFQVGAGLLRGDFGKIWEGLETIVKAPMDAIVTLVKNTFGNVLDFLRGLPRLIGAAASGMWDGIVAAFKGSLNAVIALWNALKIPSFKIGGFEAFGVKLPSFTTPEVNFPDITPIRAAAGGIFPPIPGGHLVNIAEAGKQEGVVPLPPGVIAGLERIASGDFGGTTIQVLARDNPVQIGMEVAAQLRAEQWKRTGT